MVGIKTTGEQISILCHNGTIFDKPGEKTGLATKDMLESEIIQNKPPTKLTIGLGNRLSVVYMQNGKNTTVKQGHNS
jgi:hypothetical protein